jgi:hypothetical protein
LAIATASVEFAGRGVLGVRTGTQRGTGIFFGCHTRDASIHYGTATFRSHFRVDCTTLTVQDSGNYTIKWDNGRRTVVTYSATGVLPLVAPSFGTVVRGEFRGEPTTNLDVIAPLDGRVCIEESGSIPVVAAGVLTIG